MQVFFCFGLDDGEAFAMQSGVSAERETAAVGALKFDKEVGIFIFKAVKDFGINHNDEVAEFALTTLDDCIECALHFDTHCHGCFYPAAAFTIRAWFEQAIAQ